MTFGRSSRYARKARSACGERYTARSREPLPCTTHAREGLSQIEVCQLQAGDFRNAQPATQHEQEHGAVARIGDDGKEGLEVLFRHRPRQTLLFTQQVAPGMHRAGQRIILHREKGIECHDRRQAAVDGGGLEAPLALHGHEAVYVMKR